MVVFLFLNTLMSLSGSKSSLKAGKLYLDFLIGIVFFLRLILSRFSRVIFAMIAAIFVDQTIGFMSVSIQERENTYEILLFWSSFLIFKH